VEVRNVQTKDHEELRADVLIAANGPLSSPKFPNIPGIETFQGVSFHNLRWNASVDFTGKRVAVLGSGSSAIQFIPGLAEIPGVQLTQFIRSGGYFYPKINTEYTALQKFAFRYVPGWMRWNRYQLFLDVSRGRDLC
jgi:cation diffusion facilitator CzcD-associated flavoprotein CzcO